MGTVLTEAKCSNIQTLDIYNPLHHLCPLGIKQVVFFTKKKKNQYQCNYMQNCRHPFYHLYCWLPLCTGKDSKLVQSDICLTKRMQFILFQSYLEAHFVEDIYLWFYSNYMTVYTIDESFHNNVITNNINQGPTPPKA